MSETYRDDIYEDSADGICFFSECVEGRDKAQIKRQINLKSAGNKKHDLKSFERLRAFG